MSAFCFSCSSCSLTLSLSLSLSLPPFLSLSRPQNELTKLGVTVEEGRDFLIVHGLKPGESLKPNVEIETYDDHRVAMCFSLAACGGVPVTILDPGCTSKTFPDFFTKLDEVKVN